MVEISTTSMWLIAVFVIWPLAAAVVMALWAMLFSSMPELEGLPEGYMGIIYKGKEPPAHPDSYPLGSNYTKDPYNYE